MIQDLSAEDFLKLPGVTALAEKIAPNHAAGGVIIKHGQLIASDTIAFPAASGKTSFRMFGEFHPSRYKPLMAHPPQIAGEISEAVFVNGSHNYYHFFSFHCTALFFMRTMTHKAPRALVTQNGFPASAQNFLMEMMPIFSAGGDVEITRIGNGTYNIRDVIIPWRPAIPLVAFVAREIILPFAMRKFGITSLSELDKIKLYVKRVTAAKTRELVNQDDVERWFAGRGYTSVDPGTLTIPEQIILFARATHIAGPEGAAFTNLLYAINAVSVLMITSPTVAAERFFPSLAKAGGFEIQVLVGEVVDKSSGRNAAYIIPMERLNQLSL